MTHIPLTQPACYGMCKAESDSRLHLSSAESIAKPALHLEQTPSVQLAHWYPQAVNMSND